MTDDTLIDIDLVCCECRMPFVWTAGQQAFYAEKGFRQPKRCRECAAKKRAQMEQQRGWN